MHQTLGKWLIVAGLLLVVVGGIIYLLGNKFGWLGRLPGDIVIKKENFTFYFPITTMLLLSAVLTLLAWLWRWISKG
ncbi:MAG: DUF2905 domain-containing protein [Chitinophagales bacterium]|nr:DUF2905 domain-containing protein [Chitinophagales bacterium]MDW8428252.1 DUF2905 domain-containing protein [Chitinophagales bacterium]